MKRMKAASSVYSSNKVWDCATLTESKVPQASSLRRSRKQDACGTLGISCRYAFPLELLLPMMIKHLRDANGIKRL